MTRRDILIMEAVSRVPSRRNNELAAKYVEFLREHVFADAGHYIHEQPGDDFQVLVRRPIASNVAHWKLSRDPVFRHPDEKSVPTAQ